jgi:hypothetical protein
MKRDYVQGTSTNITFFTGIEVEKTLAHGKKTLFVVGLHNPQQILDIAVENNCEHIYMGANQSYDNTNAMTWSATIRKLLESGLLVTLDFDISYINDIIEESFDEYHNFIAQISIKIPYVRHLGYNSYIKIDDIDFKATNPGVWVHSLHELTNKENYTNWAEYTKDNILK